MRQRLLLIVLVIFSTSAVSQVPVGKWRDHFAYRRANYSAIGAKRVYAAASNGVFWYNPVSGHTGKLSTVNGLSDVGITAIEYSDGYNMLAVGYENGNIDLVFDEQRVVNLPFVMQKQIQGSKRINHFYFDKQGQILVSTGFGIVVINVDKREIKDTYYIAPGGADCWVNETIEFENKIFAATSVGVLSAQIDNPMLIHYANWSQEQGLPADSEFSSLALFKDKLFAVQSTGGSVPDALWAFDGITWVESITGFLQIRNISANSNHLLVTSRQGILLYTNFPSAYTLINQYNDQESFNPNFAAIDEVGNLIIADNSNGLVYGKPGSWTHHRPNGPDEDRSYFVMPTAEDVYVLAGARTDVWGNRFFPLMFHRLSNNQWRTTANHNFFDAVRITQSPSNFNEYYVSSWGHGVVVYRDGQVVDNYTPENSSLQTILPGAYCRVGGVVFDTQGNMWVSNAGVPNPISVRLADGTWKSFPYESVISSQRQSDIFLSPSGDIWVILPSGGGLFVLDPGDNPGLMESHRARKPSLIAPDGEGLPSDILSLAFDREGFLWVGTTEGVLVSYNPHRVMEPAEFAIQRVRVPDELDGFAAFLLQSQTITTIAVDGGNRKWFGTQRSGVYLQSADGSQQLQHFTRDNSPLPSNTIEHIGIHPVTGEVFFATDRGLISFRGDATEPSDKFEKVYAFPNPVRPDFHGPITITGLVENTNVKITDIAGNLVYEVTSHGGQATWDGRNLNGMRVSTGVYLFFCSDSSGTETVVGKILFIK
jgi:hypothetical protein